MLLLHLSIPCMMAGPPLHYDSLFVLINWRVLVANYFRPLNPYIVMALTYTIKKLSIRVKSNSYTLWLKLAGKLLQKVTVIFGVLPSNKFILKLENDCNRIRTTLWATIWTKHSCGWTMNWNCFLKTSMPFYYFDFTFQIYYQKSSVWQIGATKCSAHNFVFLKWFGMPR